MSNQLPQISIVLPVHNGSRYLAECLDSILAQTRNDWELVAVDDFSEDQSLSILLDYAAREPRMKVISNQKRGLLGALRMAVEHASSEVLTRIDQDDKMPPERLEKMYPLVAGGSKVVALGLVECFVEEGELGNGYQRYQNWLNDLTSRQANYSEIYKECTVPSPAWMASREAMEVALKEDVYPEDYQLAFTFRALGYEVKAVQETVLFWRDHAARGSRNVSWYEDNRFAELKLRWFLKTDYQPTKPLYLWGAGKRGKQLAKLLIEESQPFHWVCNNVEKIGKQIYEVEMESTEELFSASTPQIIVAVAGPDDQTLIREMLEKAGLRSMKDFFFFC